MSAALGRGVPAAVRRIPPGSSEDSSAGWSSADPSHVLAAKAPHRFGGRERHAHPDRQGIEDGGSADDAVYVEEVIEIGAFAPNEAEAPHRIDLADDANR